MTHSFLAMIGLGVVSGIIGGLFGIGGGLIMVPALVLLFGFHIREATGTSLMAQLLPVGLFAVGAYWRRGEVQVGAGLWIALGLLVGALFGALLAGVIPPGQIKRAYGAFLVLVGLYFLWGPPLQPRSAPAPAPAEPPAPAHPASR